jgi:putative hydrolase of the HAD superfamily
MAIRVVVFDIGGILEVIPGGGDPTRLFAPMMATWEARLHLAPGELDARLEELEARLASEGKDGSIGTCTEEEWQEGVRQVTGMDEAQMAAFLRDFWDVYMGNPNDELIAYFAGLHSHCRTAIISNSFIGARRAEEERFHFSEMAELIIYSHEEGVAKPDPRIFTLACERLGVQPEEMIFLDDVETNVAAARALGIHAIQFRDNTQAIADIEALLNADTAALS